jgi:xylulose-5-phosphate/fructose-6-phosphate phosphoketolase
MPGNLSAKAIGLLDAYWRAANFLTIGQIYLQDNLLLREPLTPAHIKPRLLGHWGTSPGQNFIYVHLNRLIKETDASVIYISGPGHGGPALVAQTYLEGTYSEFHPQISRDLDGMRRLFRQFSTPGGVPSHAGPHVPGSIHEGGELGYSLAHAFGAAFDDPDLLVACVIGDGEAETAPLEGAWKGIKFLNPVRDGPAIPGHGCRPGALYARSLHLEVGEQRPRSRTRRGDVLHRRRLDPGDPRGGLAAAQARA